MSITPVGTPFTFIVADLQGNTVTSSRQTRLTTGATGGFLYVPQMSGAPSSTGATGYTGTVAMCFDSSNNMPWYLNPNNTFGGSTGPAQLNWVAGNGQVLIGRTTLTSATGLVSFTGISQAFNHLRVVVTGRVDLAGTITNVGLRFNGDSGNNYSGENIDIRSTTISSGESYSMSSTRSAVMAGTTVTANFPSSNIFDIPNYTNATFNKTVLTTGIMTSSTAGQTWLRLAGSAWANTSAITSVSVFAADGGGFIAGSMFYLYGVW